MFSCEFCKIYKNTFYYRTPLVAASARFRSSCQDVFCKKGVLRNFAKFTGKHLCQSLYFNKVAGLRPEACNVIKIETLAQLFSCEFWEISINTFSYKTLPVAASGGYLNVSRNSWKIRVNEFIFRTYNFTKNYLKWLTLLKKYS